jgi:hypothetical protein
MKIPARYHVIKEQVLAQLVACQQAIHLEEGDGRIRGKIKSLSGK